MEFKSDKEKQEDKEYVSQIDKLNKLKSGLYRRKGGPVQGRVEHELHEKDYGLAQDWGRSGLKKEQQDIEAMSSPWIKKLFLVSIGFFLVSIAVVAYVIYGGSNVVSSKNIDIEVVGPVSVGGGEEFSLQISLANHNTVSLELADLIVEFPEGTKSAENLSQDLIRLRKTIGTIKPGQAVNELARSVFFGEENDQKEILITLEYRVAGSNAIFVKEKTYTVAINRAPVSLSVVGLKEVSTNQEFRLDVEVVSNSESVVNDLMIKVDYPFGFQFTDASPPPTFGENSWRLGDFAPGSKRKVTIRGVMKGQDDEKKFFRVVTGTQSPLNDKEVGIVYNSSFHEISLRQPFLGAVLKIGGEFTSEYIAESNRIVEVEVDWVNNLPVRINDAVIVVSLDGQVLDEASVKVERGTYDSSNNTAIWDKRVAPELGVIESGESGRVRFTFSPKDINQFAIKNPEVSIGVSVSGNRSAEDNVPQEVRSFVEGSVKFKSNPSITSRAVYYTGPFSNTGPIPPKAEQETTYTVIWTVLNTSNNISSAQVKTALPNYVRWLNVASPSNEKITYNQATGDVVWGLGDVKAGTGIDAPAREVIFQISLLPSLNQIGDSPVLVPETVFVGDDDFTGTELRASARRETTRLATDPGFRLGDESVTQ